MSISTYCHKIIVVTSIYLPKLTPLNLVAVMLSFRITTSLRHSMFFKRELPSFSVQNTMKYAMLLVFVIRSQNLGHIQFTTFLQKYHYRWLYFIDVQCVDINNVSKTFLLNYDKVFAFICEYIWPFRIYVFLFFTTNFTFLIQNCCLIYIFGFFKYTT